MISVAAAKPTPTSRSPQAMTQGALLAALSWILFLIAAYSPLSNLAVEALIGILLSYQFLSFGMESALLMAVTIAVLSLIRPGFPINLGLILYFLPWPLIKGRVEFRCYDGGLEGGACDGIQNRDQQSKWAIRRPKLIAAFVIYVVGIFIMRTIYPDVINSFRERFNELRSVPFWVLAVLGFGVFLALTYFYDWILDSALNYIHRVSLENED